MRGQQWLRFFLYQLGLIKDWNQGRDYSKKLAVRDYFAAQQCDGDPLGLISMDTYKLYELHETTLDYVPRFGIFPK